MCEPLNPKTVGVALAGIVLFSVLITALGQTDLAIEHGNIVSIEYTLRLDDGSVGASNVGGSPLVYEAGGSRVLPALDRALMGMKAGEIRNLSLTPQQAYGPVREELIVEVGVSGLPQDSRRIGAVVVATDAEGEKKRAIVREVRNDTVVLDYNHPFAGQRIHFTIRIVDVK